MDVTLETPRLLEKQIDRLYALPLEQFTAARDALARGLRASGDRDGAARVRLQQQPTVAAWAVNQLVRRKPRELRALFAAADRVRLAAGETAARQSLEAEQSALAVLTGAAREILEQEERRRHGVVERVAATLRLGAADPELRRVLKAGRLTRELLPRGLEAAPVAHPGRRREDREEERRAALERMQRLEREVRDLTLTVRAAEGRVRDAEREAERAHREAEEVRTDLRRAGAELDTARADAGI